MEDASLQGFSPFYLKAHLPLGKKINSFNSILQMKGPSTYRKGASTLLKNAFLDMLYTGRPCFHRPSSPIQWI